MVTSLLPKHFDLGIDPQPLRVAPDTLLKDVITQMCQSSSVSLPQTDNPSQSTQRYSYALVMNSHKLLGIVTYRDLVKLVAADVSLADQTAVAVMNPHVVTLKLVEIEDVFTPLNLMRQYRIRHLPVINEQDEVCGVITAAQLRQSLPDSALLKRRQVKEIMVTQVITALPSDRVVEVAKLMATHHVSCVVIQQPHSQTPLGIITEHDIIQITRLELDLNTLVVNTVMSCPLVCVHPDDGVGDVQTKMKQLHVRRLVVVTDQGHLAGLVTQTSVLSVLDPQEMATTIDLLQQQVKKLQNERVTLLQNRNAMLETQIQTRETSLLVWEEKFRSTFEQAAVGIAHTTFDGQLMALNHRFADILGYQPAELLHRSFLEFIHLEDQTIGLDAMESLLQGTLSSFSQEKRYLRKEGSILWGNITVSIAHQPADQPDYIITVLEDISDRKQAETDLQQLNQDLEARVASSIEKFKASERRYRTLFTFAPDFLFVLNMQGEIQTINSAVTERLGYTQTALEGHLLSDLFTVDFRLNYQQDFASLLEQGHHSQEIELLSQDGTSFCVDSVCAVITETRDQDPYILVIQRDISDRKLLESRLRSSEQQIRAMFEAMHDVVLTCTLVEGVITEINIAPTTQIRHHNGTDVLVSHTVQYLWNNTQEAAGQSMQQVIVTGDPLQFEYRLTIGEQKLWFMANISLLSDQSVLWVAHNISIYKLTEESLQQFNQTLEALVNSRTTQLETTYNALKISEAQYQDLYDNAPDMYASIDAETTKVLQCNQTLCDTLGLSPEDILNRSVFDLYHPDCHPQAKLSFQTFVETGEIHDAQLQLQRSEGSKLEVSLNVRAVFDPSGKVLYSRSSWRDITQRKQLESDLHQATLDLEKRVDERTQTLHATNLRLEREISEREQIDLARQLSEERLQLALDGSGDGLWDWNIATDALYLSPQWLEMLGYEEGELPATISTWEQLVHPEDQPWVNQLLTHHIQNSSQPYAFDYRVKTKSGEWKWIGNYGKVVAFNTEGQPLRMAGTHKDISARKRRDKQINASLEEKVVMLQEIHHRVKNNLQVICSLLSLQVEANPDSAIAEIMQESQNRVQSMALVHENLYKSHNLSDICLSSYVKELTNNLVRSYCARNSLIQIDLDIANIYLDIDTAVPCGLIINELVSNSLKYAFPPQQKGNLQIKITQKTKQIVSLIIADNGIGLPTEINVEQTQTLGLKMVKILTQQISGTLNINRETGTVFQIDFPQHSALVF